MDNNADRILELVTTDKEHKSPKWINGMLDWLSEREDEEVVEVLRLAAATLAYRSVTSDEPDGLRPTGEVFITALRRITETFAKHVDESES